MAHDRRKSRLDSSESDSHSIFNLSLFFIRKYCLKCTLPFSLSLFSLPLTYRFLRSFHIIVDFSIPTRRLLLYCILSSPLSRFFPYSLIPRLFPQTLAIVNTSYDILATKIIPCQIPELTRRTTRRCLIIGATILFDYTFNASTVNDLQV